MILKPLQKIQVVESTKICKAGSLGYFVAQNLVGRYNAWDMCIVFTRFGKRGKPRIEPVSINTFMIDYDTMEQVDKNIMNIVKFYDGLEPRPYTHKGIDHQSELGTSTITSVPMDAKNLLELSDNEFTAYIVALSLFIHKIIHGTAARLLYRTPRLEFGNFADTGFDLMSAEVEYLGYYILHGLKRDSDGRRRRFDFAGDQSFGESYARQIDSKDKKRSLLSKLHMGLAMSKNAFEKYNSASRASFSSVFARIDDILGYYRHNKKELASIKRSEEEVMEKRKNVHGRPERYAVEPMKVKIAGG